MYVTVWVRSDVLTTERDVLISQMIALVTVLQQLQTKAKKTQGWNAGGGMINAVDRWQLRIQLCHKQNDIAVLQCLVLRRSQKMNKLLSVVY